MTGPVDPILAERVAALEAGFRHIANTRMVGLSLLNARLAVEAVGFERESPDAPIALGVLVTPWFMSLLRLPLCESAAAGLPAVGCKQMRDCGPRCFEFIGAQEAGIGRYEASGLFSPMFEFADAAAARATAKAVLALLRRAEPPAAAPAATPTATATSPTAPARRGFLFGRAAAGGPP